MKVIIDRFEGQYAVCEKEDRTIIDIDISSLPKDAKKGDVLNIVDNKIEIDIKATKKIKKEIEELTKDIWN